jgi:hypothetical protein
MEYSKELVRFRKFKSEARGLYGTKDLGIRREKAQRLAVKYKTNVNSVFDIFNEMQRKKRR